MNIDLLPLIETAGAALIALAGIATTLLIRWIYSKTKSAIVDRALTAVSQACHLAVTQVWTNYVEALKAEAPDGKLTDSDKSMARSIAIQTVKSFLGPKGLALIVKGLGVEAAWLESFLGASVESSLASLRRAERQLSKKLTTFHEIYDRAEAPDPTPASVQD
ncbi:MAG: hypothetical protein LBM75_09300 [Myxococcales bacterium]|jgi:hypothetical protein|nr:hypothetical protein [Myxococcales bacterium]